MKCYERKTHGSYWYNDMVLDTIRENIKSECIK